MNPRPRGYETLALPAELPAQKIKKAEEVGLESTSPLRDPGAPDQCLTNSAHSSEKILKIYNRNTVEIQ